MVTRFDAEVERVRMQEQAYLRLLSGINGLQLHFTCSSRTDGNTITVNPEYLLPGDPALSAAAEHCGITAERICAADPLWRLFLRGVALHELFHVLYSRFESIEMLKADRRAAAPERLAALQVLGNLIEDCYVNNAGTSEFTGCGPVIRYVNEAALILGGRGEEKKNREDYDFSDFIDQAYLEFKNGKTVAAGHEMYDRASPLIYEATLSNSAKKRLSLVREIFDIVDCYGGLGERPHSTFIKDVHSQPPVKKTGRPLKGALSPLYNGRESGLSPLLFDMPHFGGAGKRCMPIELSVGAAGGVLLIVYADLDAVRRLTEPTDEALEKVRCDAEKCGLAVVTHRIDADNLTDLCIKVQRLADTHTAPECIKNAAIFILPDAAERTELDAAVRRLGRAGIAAEFQYNTEQDKL